MKSIPFQGSCGFNTFQIAFFNLPYTKGDVLRNVVDSEEEHKAALSDKQKYDEMILRNGNITTLKILLDIVNKLFGNDQDRCAIMINLILRDTILKLDVKQLICEDHFLSSLNEK